MKKSLLALVAAAATALLLSACVTMGGGTVAPRDLGDRLAYTQAGVTAARATAAGMLERGRIGQARGTQLLDATNEAADTVNMAHGAIGMGDMSAAEAKMQAAIVLLTAITARPRDAMEAANVALDLLTATSNAQAAGSRVSQLIQAAGGKPLGNEAWAELMADDNAAKQRLVAALAGVK